MVASLKRVLCMLLAMLLLSCATPAVAEETGDKIVEPTLSKDAAAYDAEHPELLEEDQLIAYSAILIAEDSGEVIFEKDADTLRYPASTTKIMTVLLGLMMVDDLNQTVTVSQRAVDVPADSAWKSRRAWSCSASVPLMTQHTHRFKTR